METKISRKKRTKFTPSVILNILLIVGVLMIIGLVLYTPKTDFFKGALVLRPQMQESKEDQMPGALLIDYVTKTNDVRLNGELVTLTSFVLEAEYEKIDISSFLFEFEGDLGNGSVLDTKLLVDGHEPKNAKYIWISSTRLLVDMSESDVSIDDRLPIMLQGVIKNVDVDETISVLVSDISATGEKLNKAITNIGVKGDINAAGTILHIQK